ncbi:MAG: hypothetical protein HUJ25_14615 [Crocinitomicaceae bacterium]|nr:hypothetical protein [Crocinitomicaceae bacterium]
MKQIKKSFVKKKTGHTKKAFKELKNPQTIKSLLLISNSSDQSLKKKVEELFSAASVYHLFPREIKEDSTTGFYYSVHKSDFNLTGKLKNDKLSNLEDMKVDLLVDLSSDSELLNYFVSRVQAGLKVGDINSNKVVFYDLLVEFEASDNQNAEIIFHHLNNFTQHAIEQV